MSTGLLTQQPNLSMQKSKLLEALSEESWTKSSSCSDWLRFTLIPTEFPLSRNRAMREASERRMATDTDSYAFLYNHKRQRGEDRGIEERSMISDVILKNKMYYVLDERGKEISSNWDSSLGDLMGFTGTFMIFRKNKMYYSYNERCKQIANKWESSLGEFRSVAGNSVNFRKNKMIYTTDKFLNEISCRWE